MAPRYGMKGKPVFKGSGGGRLFGAEPLLAGGLACRLRECRHAPAACPSVVAAPIACYPAAAAPPTVDGGLLEEALGVGVGQRLDGGHGLDVQVLQGWEGHEAVGRLAQHLACTLLSARSVAPPAVQRPQRSMRLAICRRRLPRPGRRSRPTPCVDQPALTRYLASLGWEKILDTSMRGWTFISPTSAADMRSLLGSACRLGIMLVDTSRRLLR